MYLDAVLLIFCWIGWYVGRDGFVCTVCVDFVSLFWNGLVRLTLYKDRLDSCVDIDLISLKLG